MPFDTDTKTRAFIRCGRLCCLCLKQCGTNIEAAHIIAEADGGPNADENLIPLCFDCHQETGAYDNRQPRGNRFRPEELRARRDRVFDLVETGAIYAQVVALQLRTGRVGTAASDAIMAAEPQAVAVRPSREAQQLLDELVGGRHDAVARRVRLLGESDRAWLVDQLLDRGNAEPVVFDILAHIVASDVLPDDRKGIVVEAAVRRAALGGSLAAKAALLGAFSRELLDLAAAESREAFFEELIAVVNRDTFDEVNVVTEPLARRQEAIPAPLHQAYFRAILGQADSHSFRGAPAARAALHDLPDAIARAGLATVDVDDFASANRRERARAFIERYRRLWPADRQQLFDDALGLPWDEFVAKYRQ